MTRWASVGLLLLGLEGCEPLTSELATYRVTTTGPEGKTWRSKGRPMAYSGGLQFTDAATGAVVIVCGPCVAEQETQP